MIFGNIWGLKPGIRDNKIEYISLIASQNNAAMIALTESHLKERINDYEIHIDGFTSIRSDRSVREGGGIVVYIKDNLTISDDFNDSDSMNELSCVYINEIKVALVTVYRPPDSTKESFIWSLRKINDLVSHLCLLDRYFLKI